jgi:hypothetical protein
MRRSVMPNVVEEKRQFLNAKLKHYFSRGALPALFP